MDQLTKIDQSKLVNIPIIKMSRFLIPSAVNRPTFFIPSRSSRFLFFFATSPVVATFREYSVKEVSSPRGWMKHSRPPPDHNIILRIDLPQPNFLPCFGKTSQRSQRSFSHALLSASIQVRGWGPRSSSPRKSLIGNLKWIAWHL